MKTKGDPVLVKKWRGREEEWTRLAEQATDDHIVHTCRGMAEQARRMAIFWGS